MTTKPQGLTRRKFLGQASCAAVGSIALLNTLLNLRLMSSVAAQGTGGSYKALVCLFLSGGNDSFNMLVPSDPDHHVEYELIRGGLHNATTESGGLALPNVGQPGGLLPLSPLGNLGGREFGLHPAMERLQGLFESGRAAFVCNVGSLIQPGMTRAMHDAGIHVPFGLYSHADQIEQWQTAYPEGRTTIGWAGRAADLLQSMNTANGLSMNISLGGTNLWQTGNQVLQYGLNSSGVSDLDGYDVDWDQASWGMSPIRGAAVDSQLGMDYQNLLERTFANKTRNAIEAYQVFQEATSLPLPGNVTFPNTQIGNSFRMVARTIAGRSVLGAQRQTFFVQLGGWDHHDEVIDNQQVMLGQVSEAVGAFYDALTAMGLGDQVATFTASDFGRTLTSNGRGSDHAWGGNHFVVGGGVQGRRLFGQYPDLYAENSLDTGRGRLIPTTSVDAYFAELALWFGVAKSSLPLVIPNITRFYDPTSGADPLGLFNA
ncbi:MAG: DUF1501 domain-containing protein [Terrimicrobiaceae bacterium]